MKSTAFDFVVLGAGAAGCAATRALAARYPDARIALVEEGGRHHATPTMRVPALQPFIPSMRRSTPFLRRVTGVAEDNLGGRSLQYVRGRGLGGSSVCDSMRYLRGTAADFAAWGDPAWTFDRMLPYYTGLEANSRGPGGRLLHGGEGPLAVTDPSRSSIDAAFNVRFFEACEAAGLQGLADFNDGGADGFSNFQSLVRGGTRVDVFDALIAQERHLTPKLHVMTNTRAERILFDGGRAVGVEICSSNAGEEGQLSCGRVIVCLGAIESPVLLQRSGLREGGEVLDQPAVGRNLIVGAVADLVFRAHTNLGLAPSRSFSMRNLPYLAGQWREYQGDRTGLFASLAEAGAFVRSQPGAPHADLSLVFNRTAQLGWQGWRRTLRPMEGATVTVTNHYPTSRGLVSYQPATGHTLVRSGMLTEREDVLRMDEGVQWVGLLLSPESSLRSVYHHTNEKGEHVSPFWALGTALAHPSGGLGSQRETAAFLAEYAQPSGDLFGTCALGSVVSATLAVNGVEGVSVADASIVPEPTIAISSVIGAAIGTRVAELV